jgi:hypothetical protein
METDVAEIIKSERNMWFSMWFLGSVIAFGLPFFSVFYLSMQRRNQHFKRQRDLEKRMLTLVESGEMDRLADEPFPLERRAVLWAASIILVVPAFAAMYVLSKDLARHEKHQQAFLGLTLPENDYEPQSISVGVYLAVTVVTLGLGGVYWLYKILNIYNNHFMQHRIIDYELGKLWEGKSHGESV